MKKKDIKEKTKRFFKKRYKKFNYWFTEKEHPRSKLNRNVFFYDSLKFIGLILLFLIIHSNLDKLNNIVLIFIKLGSTLQLVLAFFIIKKCINLYENLKYAVRGLNHGIKAILSILVILLLFFAFVNQDKVVDGFTKTYDEIDFIKISPITLENLNISLDLKSMSNNFNTCPQMDIKMKDTSWYGLNLKGETYDGWTIYGDATCRKGNKEGENLNYYYCGGYANGILGGTVNAYVKKTTISEDGSIGKTYKYIIWNIYDNNKEFIETKCLGDPDEYEKQQARELRKSMESGEWLFGN